MNKSIYLGVLVLLLLISSNQAIGKDESSAILKQTFRFHSPIRSILKLIKDIKKEVITQSVTLQVSATDRSQGSVLIAFKIE